MSVLIDITPTNIEFLYNGKIYKISEIMKNGDKGLTIFVDEKESVEEQIDNVIVEPKVDEEEKPINE